MKKIFKNLAKDNSLQFKKRKFVLPALVGEEEN